MILSVASCVSYFFHITPVSYDKKPSDLYTEVDRHPENYYVLDPVTAKEYISYTDNYIHPLWGFSSDSGILDYIFDKSINNVIWEFKLW